MLYCSKQGIVPLAPRPEHAVNFLASLYDQGYSYRSINCARSALSAMIFIDGKPIGTLPIVIRFMKGAFNLRPAFPKHNVTWDTMPVLLYLCKLSPVKSLSLLELSKKLATLLALISAQRTQSLSLLDTKNTTLTDNRVKFRFGDALKQSRQNFQQAEITIKAYAPDRRLCVVTVLKEYLRRTKTLRNSTQLFIITHKPFSGAAKGTLARWIKNTLTAAGVDMNIFTPHSTRAAATSAMARARIPVATILRCAGWSREQTFARYYKKEVENKELSVAHLLGKKQTAALK